MQTRSTLSAHSAAAVETARGGSGSEPASPLTRVRRHAERARYERAAIDAILDEAIVCHVGVNGPEGPVVIPTAYGRDGDRLYLHGAPGNAMLRAAGNGLLCVTVTLVDGLVLARSAFHHSMNYRSVVIFGRGGEVTAPEEKRHALAVIVEHLVPGRGTESRPPTDAELRATRVVRVPLDEASAKVRTGGPLDDAEDLALPVWAGTLPLVTKAGSAVPAADLVDGLRAPSYVTRYERPSLLTTAASEPGKNRSSLPVSAHRTT